MLIFLCKFMKQEILEPFNEKVILINWLNIIYLEF